MKPYRDGTGRPYATANDLPNGLDEGGRQHPGEFPYLRGIHPAMYTERLWRMRQYSGFGSPADTNARWKRLIAQGQHGVSCAFDLPTQLGIDSDSPLAGADAGRLGVAVDTLDDFAALFDGIPLDEHAATFNINASAPIIYAMLLETAERQGADLARVTGTLSNDPLLEYLARGVWRLPPAGSIRLMADVYTHCLDELPAFYPVNLRATLIYEAGGTAIQELGFGLACAIGYLDELARRGTDMDKAASRFSFLFFSDSNFLGEASKFRAARTLWAHLMRDRYAVLSPSGQKLRFTAAVGNFNLRAQLPELNLVRNTLGALGAVLGGCQAMLVAGMDEAFAIPSEYSSLLGLYTQQVIAFESDVRESVDPLGGSYHVERMTQQIAEAVAQTLAEVERDGGVIAAIEEGLLQSAIGESAYQYQMDEESGRRLVVGVNTPGSAPPEDPDFELHEHDTAAVEAISASLPAHRATRDADALDAALGELRTVLAGTENTVPVLRTALRAGATVGELMALCVERYGEYVEPADRF